MKHLLFIATLPVCVFLKAIKHPRLCKLMDDANITLTNVIIDFECTFSENMYCSIFSPTFYTLPHGEKDSIDDSDIHWP